MKTKKKPFLLIIIFMAMFFSCNQMEDLAESENIENVESKSNTLTKNLRSTSDWENQQMITLVSGESVATPWAKGTVPTSIPEDIRNDVKAADGWSFIYSGINAVPTRHNLIIFYNRFTGILKGFYYWDGSGQQNTAMWEIENNLNTKLFNGLDHFTTPLQSIENQTNIASVLNVVRNSTKSFDTKAWNCFQTPLTYDPYYSVHNFNMRVEAYNLNIMDFKLEGEFSSASNGSIVSVSSSGGDLHSKIINGMITQTGNEGKKWIQTMITKGVIKDAGANILTGGVPAIITSGINLIFGSFFGKSTPSTTTSTLQFSTKGSMSAKILGQDPTGGLVTPITGIATNSEERLGNWNLEKQPTIVFDDRAYGGNGSYVRKMEIEDANVILNDKVKEKISKYEVRSEVVYYGTFNGNDRWNGERTAYPNFMEVPHFTEKVYQEKDQNGKIKNEFWVPRLNKIYYNARNLPITNDGVTRPHYQIERTVNRGIPYNEKPGFVVKVTVTMYPKTPEFNADPIVTTRTFKAKQIVRTLKYAGW